MLRQHTEPPWESQLSCQTRPSLLAILSTSTHHRMHPFDSFSQKMSNFPASSKDMGDIKLTLSQDFPTTDQTCLQVLCFWCGTSSLLLVYILCSSSTKHRLFSVFRVLVSWDSPSIHLSKPGLKATNLTEQLTSTLMVWLGLGIGTHLSYWIWVKVKVTRHAFTQSS